MLYAIQVKAGEEHETLVRFAECITAEGEEAFVPTYDRKKKFRGEEKVITAVLFPGYVFFRTEDVESLFFRLKKLPRLTKILRAENTFLPVSQEEDEQLTLLGGPDHHITVSIGVIEAGQVKILTGPMENFKGPIRHIDRHKRIAIIGMEIGGRMHDVEIGLEITKKS
ncbi:MAG: antiterminator LoaP [Lachnospiraceae bacterium]|nr:antiterminator LoaP [Lachnospiraceae bacterium]